MGRFHHGHSAGLGFLLALALVHGHVLWLLTVAAAGGFVVGRCWELLGRLMRAGVRRLPAIWPGGAWKVW
jgi:hypothetical protein